MASSEQDEGKLVLVCAPFGRDGASIATVLEREGIRARRVASIDEIADGFDDEVGLILLAEEALSRGQGRLAEVVAAQPDWSDVPFVLVAAQRPDREPRPVAVLRRLLPATSNVIMLDRPLGVASLVSTVSSALLARARQFERRDQVAALALSRAALAESEDRLRLATEAAAIGTWDYDPVSGQLQWDRRCRDLFGVPREGPVTYGDSFLERLHPDDRGRTEAAIGKAFEPGGDGRYDVEYRVGERWLAASGNAVFVDGKVSRFIGTIVDISDRKRAEAVLADSAAELERRVAERTAELRAEVESRAQVEAALRQSQKMEAVGQLTGGIAHDFNNMLTGVIGSLDIMKRRIASGRTEDLDRFMDAAITSAQRAAGLTSRLLAFSRRQTLDSKPTDINALVGSLEDLVRRTISERIELRVVRGESLPQVVADANQLESAILNLSINARDAMPDGGMLTIETSEATVDERFAATRADFKPGRYVVIAISDTGVGMPPEILDKVFEPFFTTKPLGQGTGLGLSMVYGFVRQSGGHVRVHSQPGLGTSVTLYLPACVTADARAAEVVPSEPTKEGQGQGVLVVEDDASVRQLIREVLSELGYKAIEAPEPQAAVSILASERHIDLMVSDVGLPGMNGRQLAEIARQHRPDLPILFVTGYAENAAIRSNFLGTNMGMITKPFALDDLAAKVDEMLVAGQRRQQQRPLHG